MARNIAAAGYESVAGSIYAPPRISAKIVQNYHLCSITAQLANSNFFSDDEIFCGSKVIYGVEQDLNMFASERDINESPETLSGAPADTASLTICNQERFRWKLSNYDRRIMCDNFSQWEASLQRLISRNIIRLVDAYSIPKIVASAPAYNVGAHAGKQTGSINLGDQGSNALDGNTKTGFESLIYSLVEAGQEAGLMCGEGEVGVEGDASAPVIVIPSKLQRYAMAVLKELNTCCSDQNAFITGKLGHIQGMPVYVTSYLAPVDIGSGMRAPVMLIDPKQVLHAFDVVTNKWFEGEFEDYLVGEFAWETHVFNPDGVIVAQSKV